jgi:hypothetical protein
MGKKVFIMIGLVMLLLMLMQGMAKAQILDTQRQALIDLYNNTGGDTWVNSNGWIGDPGTECDWYGVTCNETEDYVIWLTLETNDLEGAIPSSISDLTELSDLDLSGNFITEPIPDLSSLNYLRRIDLGQNNIGGTIPTHLSGVTALLTLILADNDLDGEITIPTSQGDLSQLETLDLGNNHLDGAIPSNITYLTALTHLYVQSNQLAGAFPSGFNNLNLLDNGSNFCYNALSAGNSTMLLYVNAKQEDDIELATTQTVAPDNLTAGSIEDHSITLSWTPIEYQDGGGGYEIDYGHAGGGWTPIPETDGRTADKSDNTYTVTDLISGTRYAFRVRTVTLSRTGYNDNEVKSEYAIIDATTTGEPPDDEGGGCFINTMRRNHFKRQK